MSNEPIDINVLKQLTGESAYYTRNNKWVYKNTPENKKEQQIRTDIEERMTKVWIEVQKDIETQKTVIFLENEGDFIDDGLTEYCSSSMINWWNKAKSSLE